MPTRCARASPLRDPLDRPRPAIGRHHGVRRRRTGRLPFPPRAISGQGPGGRGRASLDAEARALWMGTVTATHLGPDHLTPLAGYDVAFRSPGVPLRDTGCAPRRRRSRVTSQTALFFALCEHRVVGVTGTKGKSTTSALITCSSPPARRESTSSATSGRAWAESSPLLTLERAQRPGDLRLRAVELPARGPRARAPASRCCSTWCPSTSIITGASRRTSPRRRPSPGTSRARDWLVYDAVSPSAKAARVAAAQRRAQLMTVPDRRTGRPRLLHRKERLQDRVRGRLRATRTIIRVSGGGPRAAGPASTCATSCPRSRSPASSPSTTTSSLRGSADFEPATGPVRERGHVPRDHVLQRRHRHRARGDRRAPAGSRPGWPR